MHWGFLSKCECPGKKKAAGLLKATLRTYGQAVEITFNGSIEMGSGRNESS